MQFNLIVICYLLFIIPLILIMFCIILIPYLLRTNHILFIIIIIATCNKKVKLLKNSIASEKIYFENSSKFYSVLAWFYFVDISETTLHFAMFLK